MGASPQTPAAWSHRPDPAISYLGLRRSGYPGTGSIQCEYLSKVLLARCARGKKLL